MYVVVFLKLAAERDDFFQIKMESECFFITEEGGANDAAENGNNRTATNRYFWLWRNLTATVDTFVLLSDHKMSFKHNNTVDTLVC